MINEFEVKLTDEELISISCVDLAYAILNASGNTFHYKDLLLEIGRRKGLPQEELNDMMATIYSEINTDGRFVSIGQNVWGLKRWYPTEKAAKTGPTPKRFKRNDEDYDDYDLDDDFYLDDEDYDEDELDEDEDDLDTDNEDDLEVDDDYDVDDELEDLDDDIEELDDEDDLDEGFESLESLGEAEDEDEDEDDDNL